MKINAFTYSMFPLFSKNVAPSWVQAQLGCRRSAPTIVAAG